MRLSRTSTDERDAESLEPLMHEDGASEDDEMAEKRASSSLDPPRESAPTKASLDATAKLWAAAFYAISSLGTVFVMKIVLTSYRFPSSMFLALSQFTLTTVVFGVLGVTGQLAIAAPSLELLWRVAPLTLIFLLNVVTGLGGTKEISLPMFTVLRRFSILFTMLLEASVFGHAPPYAVKASVGMMLGGAIVAAMSDLSFHPVGYGLVLANDVCTAMNGVAIRFTLGKQTKDGGEPISKNSLLFYNSALGAVAVGIFMLMVLPGELRASVDFHLWSDPAFVALFVSAAAAGCILNYAIFLCTQRNSALTTTVIGCLKNVLTSYIGMAVGGDYVFSWPNFAGLNISIAGSLVYSYVTFGSGGGGGG